MPPLHAPAPSRRTELPALRAVGAALLLATLAALLGGCGSSQKTGTAADPAGVVPASAPLYAGAIVRPSGSEKTAALAAGRTLTHQTDPYLRLLEVLQTPGSPPLNFSADVAPWLGPQAGIFASSLGVSGSLLAALGQGLLGSPSTTSLFPFPAGGAQGAVVLDTSDTAKARSFLESQARRAGARPAGYRGVTYQATPGGLAFGMVDRFAVIGSQAGLRSVIDTALGGPSLAHAAAYSKLRAAAPSGALAHLYVNPTASTPRNRRAGEPLTGLLGLLAGPRPVDLSLVPSARSIALDAAALTAGSATASGGLLSSTSEAARALGELPGESWFAVGLGDVKATLGEDVRGLRGLASLAGSPGGSTSNGPTGGTSINLSGLLNGLFTPLGILGANSAQARHDFQSWMGSAAIFASGSGLLELRAAVVIASTNPALSRAAVAKLAQALRKAGGSVEAVSIPGTDASVAARLPGLPVTLDIASGRDAHGQARFVIGLGEASVTTALNPPSVLSGAPSYSAAASALGEGIQPSLIVNFPTFLSLLEGLGLSEGPAFSRLVPYLRALTTLAGGGKSLGGGVQRYRLVFSLQPAA